MKSVWIFKNTFFKEHLPVAASQFDGIKLLLNLLMEMCLKQVVMKTRMSDES